MSTSLKNTFIFLSLFFTVLCFQSCKTEGCTDPNAINFNSDADTDDGSCIIEGCTDSDAENYNSAADQDDGSCIFARDKFIGSYGAGESCDGGDAVGLIITITASPTNVNDIIIDNETGGVIVTGTVSGNTMSVNETIISSGTEVLVIMDGTYSVTTDDQERIDATYTLSGEAGGQTFTSSCFGVWIKAE